MESAAYTRLPVMVSRPRLTNARLPVGWQIHVNGQSHPVVQSRPTFAYNLVIIFCLIAGLKSASAA